MIIRQNILTLELRRKRDRFMFQRLLGTGPLTRRLDQIATRLNR